MDLGAHTTGVVFSVDTLPLACALLEQYDRAGKRLFGFENGAAMLLSLRPST